MSVTAGPGSVTNGLVLELDAGNVKSYAGSGTAWTDISGNGITATLQNSGAGTVSFTGGYASFAPADMSAAAGYYLVNDSRVATLTTQLTAEMIVYATSLFANGPRPLSGRATETSSPFGASLGATGISWELATTNGWFANGSGGLAAAGLNKWMHVTQTTSITDSFLRNYLNGVSIGNTAFTGTPLTGNGILVGRGYYGGVVNYAGRVALVRMYNRALTAAEISQNFNALRGRFGL